MKTWMIAVVVALTLSGCSSDPDKKRTVEDRVDDHAIASDVSRALGHVERVDRLKIRVDVLEGQVTLSGEVDDNSAAMRVKEATESVKGVKLVIDRMKRIEK